MGAAEELTAALESNGIQVLLNEAATIPAPAGAEPARNLYVVGIGPKRPGLADPEQAMSGVPDDAPRIVTSASANRSVRPFRMW